MLLSADADHVVGVEYCVETPGRVAQHNGYRSRLLDTQLGTLDVQVPKLTVGNVSPVMVLGTSETLRISPNQGCHGVLFGGSVIRFVGSASAEQTDEWLKEGDTSALRSSPDGTSSPSTRNTPRRKPTYP